MYLKVITGDTETAARRKYNEFLEQVNYDGALALLSGWSGIDFSQLDPDQPLEYVETNAVRTLLQSFTGVATLRRPRYKTCLSSGFVFAGCQAFSG